MLDVGALSMPMSTDIESLDMLVRFLFDKSGKIKHLIFTMYFWVISQEMNYVNVKVMFCKVNILFTELFTILK